MPRPNRSPLPIILAFVLAALAWYSVLAHAVPAATIEEAKATVVPLVGKGQGGLQRFCSAVVVAPGKAYTAQHCTDVPGMLVEQNGTYLPVAAVVLPNPALDFAIIEVPELACPCAEPVNAEYKNALPTGVPVAAIGYPHGEMRVTLGTMLGYLRMLGPGGDEYVLMLSTARADPGNSGGGLFAMDAAGRIWLVGIVVAYIGETNVGMSLSEPLP